MPVYRYLDLSTAHITEEEMRAIEQNFPALDDGDGPRVIAHEYGAWLNVPAADVMPEAFAEHYPNVAACLAHARAFECFWINFDQDAGTDGLPTHEW